MPKITAHDTAPPITGEIPPGEMTVSALEESFRAMSLRELSFEAARIDELLESGEDEGDDLLERLQDYLADATAAKVDGYVLYKEYLDQEIEVWKAKRDALLALCGKIILAKEARMKSLKETILRLHETGLVGDRLLGKDKAIEIRTNSKPTVEVSAPAEHLPPRYRVAKWSPDKEAIATAHAAGEDVSEFATVSYGRQIRFKNAPRRKKED
jgi:hypothetical protein